MGNMLGSTQIWDACKSAKVALTKPMMTSSRVEKRVRTRTGGPFILSIHPGSPHRCQSSPSTYGSMGNNMPIQRRSMNAFRGTITKGLVQGHVSFLTSSFVRALPTVSLPNHHVSQPNHHVPQRNHLVPPSLLPLQKYQGTRNNVGRYSTLGTIVTASIFAAGVNRERQPDSTMQRIRSTVRMRKHLVSRVGSVGKGRPCWICRIQLMKLLI